MKSYLPILVLGNNPADTRTVNVPCALPESFDFHAFLPSRGVRECTAWLTSTDPLQAEVGDVALTGKEGDPRGPSGFELDDDEQRRADDAAADVLADLLTRLWIALAERKPGAAPSISPLVAIAQTHMAEEALFCFTVALAQSFDRLMPRTAAGMDIRGMVRCDDDKTPDNSPSVYALASYVEHVLEQACLAQKEKAERQLAEHPPALEEEDVPGSERLRSPRHLDASTMKCLDVDY